MDTVGISCYNRNVQIQNVPGGGRPNTIAIQQSANTVIAIRLTTVMLTKSHSRPLLTIKAALSKCYLTPLRDRLLPLLVVVRVIPAIQVPAVNFSTYQTLNLFHSNPNAILSIESYYQPNQWGVHENWPD